MSKSRLLLLSMLGLGLLLNPELIYAAANSSPSAHKMQTLQVDYIKTDHRLNCRL